MASSSLKPLQGMTDLRAPEISRWQSVEETARRVMALYGYTEIRTPILERAELFVHATGDTTDIVQKEMYRFEDKGGRDLALRPEGTPGVMRALAAAGPDMQDARVYYLGPMFRRERPQAGRKRQFHQLGTEALGEPNPTADAECIALQLHALSEWGLEGYQLELNTRGSGDDQVRVADGLRQALRPLGGELCDDCRRRLETNVLRVLDCKNPNCRATVEGLPPVTDFMCVESRDYLAEVTAVLQSLDIEPHLNPMLVRGLDYYEHTVWEITHSALGAQDALCGGGRYRITLGNREVCGVGFAMGLERVITALDAADIPAADPAGLHVWVVTQHPSAFRENLVLAQALRRRGIRCGMDLSGRNLKKQMRSANRSGAPWAVIRGEQEMEEGIFQLKDMQEGVQEALEMPELIERLTQGLRLSTAETD